MLLLLLLRMLKMNDDTFLSSPMSRAATTTTTTLLRTIQRGGRRRGYTPSPSKKWFQSNVEIVTKCIVSTATATCTHGPLSLPPSRIRRLK